MTEKAVMIGLLVGLLGSAGVLWAKLPPREAMQSTHFKDTQNTKTAEVLPPPPEPKEVMPPDTIPNNPADIRPRLVKLPRARPVGAKRCHCHKRLRKLLVLQTHRVTP